MYPKNVQSLLVNVDVNGNHVERVLDSAGKKNSEGECYARYY